jgi:hypothetical protein
MQDVNVLKENGIRRVRAHLNVLISTGRLEVEGCETQAITIL